MVQWYILSPDLKKKVPNQFEQMCFIVNTKHAPNKEKSDCSMQVLVQYTVCNTSTFIINLSIKYTLQEHLY